MKRNKRIILILSLGLLVIIAIPKLAGILLYRNQRIKEFSGQKPRFNFRALELNREANDYKDKGNYPKAYLLYKKVIRKYPDSSAASSSLLRIACLKEESDWPEGELIIAYRKVIELYPDSFQAVSALESMRRLKPSEGKIPFYTKIINRYPDTKVAKVSLEKLKGELKKKIVFSREEEKFLSAYLYFVQGNYQKALPLYQLYLKDHPDSQITKGHYYYGLSALSFSEGKIEEAGRNIILAKTFLPPTKPLLELEEKIGKLSQIKSQLDKELAVYQEILRGNASPEKKSKAQYGIALFYLKKDDYQKASEELSKIVNNYPKSDYAPEALFKMALIQKENFGNRLKMEKIFETLMEGYPEHQRSFQALEIITKGGKD